MNSARRSGTIVAPAIEPAVETAEARHRGHRSEPSGRPVYLRAPTHDRPVREQQPAHGRPITAEGLVKIYKSRKSEVRALDGVDLEVPEGTVLGLLGPNGAGKTTTVRILATLLRAGRRPRDRRRLRRRPQADELRSVIGLSGQYAAVDENLTGRENLWHVRPALPAAVGAKRSGAPTSCSSSST